MNNKFLTRDHFLKVLEGVTSQVFSGKGKERHGSNGISFEDQPWKHISDNVGPSWLIGQALKKVFELKSLNTSDAYAREIYGAIAYLCMALMYKEYQEHESKNLHKM